MSVLLYNDIDEHVDCREPCAEARVSHLHLPVPTKRAGRGNVLLRSTFFLHDVRCVIGMNSIKYTNRKQQEA